MDPREFLNFIWRRFAALLVVVVLFFGMSMGATQRSSGEEGATVFLTLGVRLPEGVSIGALGASQNENVVDQFTQTVQGWVSDPGFVRQVSEKVDRPFDLSVRKQEKQNLIVTIQMNREDVGITPEEAAHLFLDVLNQSLVSYNELTNASFLVAVSSVSYFESSPHWALNGMVGALFGLVIAILGMGLWEYSKRTLTFEFQVNSIMGGLPLLRLDSRFNQSDLEGFVRLHAHSNGKVLLIEMGETGMKSQKSYFKEHDIELITYPEGFKAVKSFDSLVAVVRLGVSHEDHVRALSLLAGKELSYLLIV